HVSAGECSSPALNFLVDNRRALHYFSGRCRYSQVAALIELEAVRAFEVQRDGAWVGAGRDHEVILKLAPGATVIDEVDARIDLVIFHPRVRRQGRLPL